MKKLKVSFWLMFITLLVVAFAVSGFSPVVESSVQNIQVAPATVAPKTIVQKATVSRLEIPAIGVNAAIQQVGLTAKNDLDVPNNITDVAWYKLGPVPGDIGNAVIDGHLDGPYGAKGVFYNLHNIKVGDTISVRFQEGFTRTFAVQRLATYTLGQSTTDIFYSNTGKHLNLITCSGTWDVSKSTYNTRLVVFSDLVE